MIDADDRQRRTHLTQQSPEIDVQAGIEFEARAARREVARGDGEQDVPATADEQAAALVRTCLACTLDNRAPHAGRQDYFVAGSFERHRRRASPACENAALIHSAEVSSALDGSAAASRSTASTV